MPTSQDPPAGSQRAVKKASYRHNTEFLRHEEERDVEILRHTYSLEKMGNSAYDPDTPHRNELPPRDELLYQRPAPEPPSMLEIMRHLAKKKNPSAGSEQ